MPLNEGQTVQYTVTTTNTADGTVLYWKTTGNTTNSDIVGGNTGSITITNNRAFINVTMSSDTSTDGTKTLGIALLTGSLSGTTVAVTNPNAPIVVEDTSQAPTTIPVYYSYMWGNGPIGNNTASNYNAPVLIGTGATFAVAGALAPKANKTLWAWGGNSYGRLGTNNQTTYSSPVQVGSDTDWAPATNWESVSQGSVNASFFVKSNGTLWSWGQNDYFRGPGVLGHNDTVNRSSPTQVGVGTTWLKVSSAYGYSTQSAAAIKSDGTLWTWGRNNYGQLGINAGDTNVSSPTQVGALTNWSKVWCNAAFMLAIKNDGTLWSWGINGAGQLAQNNTANKSSPVQIGTNTNWNTIAGSSQSGTATTTDGKLFWWGGNYDTFFSGVAYSSSPTQIGSATDWLMVSYESALRIAAGTISAPTANTLWTWGYNGDGYGGYGNNTTFTSPKQVGSKTTWVYPGKGAALATD